MGDLGTCDHSDDKCSCKTGSAFGEGKCRVPKALGAPCTEPIECVLQNPLSYCKEEQFFFTCQCLSDALEYDNNCYEDKSVGDKCNSDKECTVPIQGDVYCDRREKVCTCGISFKPTNEGKACEITFGGADLKANSSKYMLLVAILVAFLFQAKN